MGFRNELPYMDHFTGALRSHFARLRLGPLRKTEKFPSIFLPLDRKISNPTFESGRETGPWLIMNDKASIDMV